MPTPDELKNNRETQKQPESPEVKAQAAGAVLQQKRERRAADELVIVEKKSGERQENDTEATDFFLSKTRAEFAEARAAYEKKDYEAQLIDAKYEREVPDEDRTESSYLQKSREIKRRYQEGRDVVRKTVTDTLRKEYGNRVDDPRELLAIVQEKHAHAEHHQSLIADQPRGRESKEFEIFYTAKRVLDILKTMLEKEQEERERKERDPEFEGQKKEAEEWAEAHRNIIAPLEEYKYTSQRLQQLEEEEIAEKTSRGRQPMGILEAETWRERRKAMDAIEDRLYRKFSPDENAEETTKRRLDAFLKKILPVDAEGRQPTPTEAFRILGEKLQKVRDLIQKKEMTDSEKTNFSLQEKFADTLYRRVFETMPQAERSALVERQEQSRDAFISGSSLSYEVQKSIQEKAEKQQKKEESQRDRARLEKDITMEREKAEQTLAPLRAEVQRLEQEIATQENNPQLQELRTAISRLSSDEKFQLLQDEERTRRQEAINLKNPFRMVTNESIRQEDRAWARVDEIKEKILPYTARIRRFEDEKDELEKRLLGDLPQRLTEAQEKLNATQREMGERVASAELPLLHSTYEELHKQAMDRMAHYTGPYADLNTEVRGRLIAEKAKLMDTIESTDMMNRQRANLLRTAIENLKRKTA